MGQFLLVLVGPSAAASLLKCAVTASFRITLFAAGAAPDFISPSSSFVCFSLVGQTSGRALLRVTAPSYKSCVDKEQEMSFSNGYKIQHPDIKVKQKMRFFFASIFMVFLNRAKQEWYSCHNSNVAGDKRHERLYLTLQSQVPQRMSTGK